MRGLYSLIMDENERLKRDFFFFKKKVNKYWNLSTLPFVVSLFFWGSCASHSGLNPQLCHRAHHPKLSQHRRPRPHSQHSFPRRVAAWICVCVARAHAFHRLRSSLCGGIVEVNPLLPGNGIKQWSQWDIARLMDSPLPLPHLRFSCAKVFIGSWWRQPCMTLIHLNGPGKEKKKRIFHTPAELAENNSGGLYWISISLCQNGAKCLFTVLMHCIMALVWFWLIFASDWLYSALYPSPSWALFCRTTRHKELLESRVVLLTPQDGILTSKC